MINNKNINYTVETENIVKEFKIEIIASVVENALLCSNKELLDFLSFITNENVNFTNFTNAIPFAQGMLSIQYPDIKRITPFPCGDIYDVEGIINSYRIKYGNTLKIKSLKKQAVKTLIKKL